ncbi:MAG TPA: hypothetical protein DDW76_28355 [Cyanobacteria bacterium UBA11369]|nr:hypothetical protein [Cyanobacteria bacterium UBA11371]HBE34431.1 hypothetical protein [Cyanobacteria bacterium UBA11368]HBE52574.1 hypothetical protein [Cyanobacteria bacterium UBA11369]
MTVGAPGDKYEQEADNMAASVMTMPDEAIQQQSPPQEEKEEIQRQPLANSITPLVQRQMEAEENEIQMKQGVQRSAIDGNAEASPSIESRLASASGGGSPLPKDVRAFMEPRFGADFSAVRVHTDSSAVQMNKELGAIAFAHGSDIYYGAGKAPGKDELTAHELTHVVQQGGGGQLQKSVGQQGNRDTEAVAASLTPLVQQNVIAPRIQRWVLPLDWLDYIGLAADVAERIYIELGYEEGQEKDFKRFVNTLFIAIDLVFAATPGAGGGGLALRASHSAGVAAWAATPDSIKLRIAEEVAKRMGWSATRALQAANVYFSMSSDGEGERRNVESHDSEGGHTEERHIGKSENWLRNRLQNEPARDFASSFRNEAIANRTQGQFVKQFREQIQAWLKSGSQSTFVRDFDMGESVGIVVERGRKGAMLPAVETTRARVVAARDNSSEGWHIVTSFPIK